MLRTIIPPSTAMSSDELPITNGAAAGLQLQLHPETALLFLTSLYGDYFSGTRTLLYLDIRGKREDGALDFRRFYSSIEALIKDMSTWDPTRNYWIGVGMRKSNTGGKKADVFGLTACYGDIDYGLHGHKQVPAYATKDEALRAIEAFSLRPSLLIHTGGGFHPYWLLKQPVTDNFERVEKINRGLMLALKGDVAAAEAARCLRLPGTCNVKLADNPRAVDVIWCESERRYDLADFASYEAYKVKVPNGNVALPYRGRHKAYAHKAFANEITKLSSSQELERNDQLNKSAFALGQLIEAGELDQERVEAVLHGVALSIGLDESEINGTIKSGITAGRRQPRQLPEAVLHKLSPVKTSQDEAKPGILSSKEILSALSKGEDGDASLFTACHHGRLVYDHAAGRWYVWAGHFWKEDRDKYSVPAVKAVIDVYEEEAQRQAQERFKCVKARRKEDAAEHEQYEKDLCKRMAALHTVNRQTNVLKRAQPGYDGLGITGEEWDKDPWLLPCSNGVVNLHNGSFRDGRPEDYIKTVAPTAWTGLTTRAPMWKRFLSTTFNEDWNLIRYLQRVLGYSITGTTEEQILIILWGIGRNGKGTLLKALASVLGPLAGPTESELILTQQLGRRSGAPTSDIMGFKGKRVVWVSETSDGKLLNPGMLKWLTGSDPLTGREVYGRHQVSFEPTHQLFLLTNFKPHAPARDYALWQRLRLIPFTLSFVAEPKLDYERPADLDLFKKLESERSGILAWLVRGCLAWQRKKLQTPDTVKVATEEYQAAEDTIAQFISEACVQGKTYSTPMKDLYKAYTRWADESGTEAVSMTRLKEELVGHGITRDDTGRWVYYRGIGIK